MIVIEQHSSQANHKADKARILLVDDEVNILSSLQRVLRKLPVDIRTAPDGETACDMMQSEQFHVVISDMKMPGLSGAQLMQWTEANSPDTYRIILTGFSELDATIDAINLGKVQRFIQKPWQNDDLIEAVSDGIKSATLKAENKRLQALVEANNAALTTANEQLEAKVEKRTRQIYLTLRKLRRERKGIDKMLYNFIGINPSLSGEFALKVAKLASNLAMQLDLEEELEHNITLSGMLCEIGLLGAEREIIRTPFEALGIQQRERYFDQVNVASSILMPAEHLSDVADILMQQFERWNGKGYPSGLGETQISIGARILAVARDFWRYVDGRISSELLDHAKALDKIKQLAGKYYDPVVAKTLITHYEALVAEGNGHRHTSAELEVGMVLLRSLFSKSHMLVLPEGHEFTIDSIERIKQFEQHHDVSFMFDVNYVEEASE